MMKTVMYLYDLLWTIAHQAPLSMEFSRQEYWSGLPFPTPGHLPDPGIEHLSTVSTCWQVDSLPLSVPRELHELKAIL